MHTIWVSVASDQAEFLVDLPQVNRNKRSIGLSFAHPAGVDILHRLVKECDVLVENYLPGSLAKYAMDYDTVSKINPVSQG